MSHLDTLLAESGKPTVAISGRISKQESKKLDELLEKKGITNRPKFVAAVIRDAIKQLEAGDG